MDRYAFSETTMKILAILMVQNKKDPDFNQEVVHGSHFNE